MQANGPVLSGDGLPSFGMLRLQDKELRDKTFTVLSGGFHTMLETLKMRGKMFAPGHMDSIWKLWRPSEKQRAWVFCPGDPNQVIEEMVMYYFALIASVAYRPV